MVYPEDRVLVGVINTKRDLRFMQEENWYRIPIKQMPDGVYFEYIAFYLSRTAASDKSTTGVHYFARNAGYELAFRRELIPKAANHPRADDLYYKVQLQHVYPKAPPIRNPNRRPVGFIYTTWDRFVTASEIADLYDDSDYLVDRLFHALRDRDERPQRYWDKHQKRPGFRVMRDSTSGFAFSPIDDDEDDLEDHYEITEDGLIHDPQTGHVYFRMSQTKDEILKKVLDYIHNSDSVVTWRLPVKPDN
jgi:hypothetical protein